MDSLKAQLVWVEKGVQNGCGEYMAILYIIEAIRRDLL